MPKSGHLPKTKQINKKWLYYQNCKWVLSPKSVEHVAHEWWINIINNNKINIKVVFGKMNFYISFIYKKKKKKNATNSKTVFFKRHLTKRSNIRWHNKLFQNKKKYTLKQIQSIQTSLVEVYQHGVLWLCNICPLFLANVFQFCQIVRSGLCLGNCKSLISFQWSNSFIDLDACLKLMLWNSSSSSTF